MGSSAGRRSAAYVAARERFKTGRYPCCLASGPWCTGRGTTVEHDPPLDTAPSVAVWESWLASGRARYRPACPACQSRQGAALVNAKRLTATNWRW